MELIVTHWRRILVTLVPVVFAMLHAAGVYPVEIVQRLDNLIYDARLMATAPKTLDPRVVIIDIDEKSLAEVGRWPWGRDKLAHMVDYLFEQQKVAVLGFDVVFAEADESSGLARLKMLANNELKDQPGFVQRLDQLEPQLDFDALFAQSLYNRPVALGYYFDREGDGARVGVLPPPAASADQLQGRTAQIPFKKGYTGNLAALIKHAPHAGHFDTNPDADGVIRRMNLLIETDKQYYQALALSMYRMLLGTHVLRLGFSDDRVLSRNQQALNRLILQQDRAVQTLPVDHSSAVLIPFRGPGGPEGGSFQYISASDVLKQRIAPGALKDKIVLVGTSAPGLMDLRVTPFATVYPGVETHANLIIGFLDGNLKIAPDYAIGYDFVVLGITGLLLLLTLPMLSASRAIVVSAGVVAALVALNSWLYLGQNLVMPLAAGVVMTLSAFVLNMSYGYFVESRSKRDLANLFGTYVPPELVDEMVKDPDAYSMKATTRELTVMFCDMRGFTKMSEYMDPVQLQQLLNDVFSRLTSLIRANRGTIDKYMGDCVMAFWGAPVETAEHAHLAVKSALEMSQAVRDINAEHKSRGLPEIGIGIGLNTGSMCVGDMGSNIRRSYTVIGDAVNLGSRLEGLSKTYGVEIIISETTRQKAPDFVWQELDLVRVKGKEQAVAIFDVLAAREQLSAGVQDELKHWGLFLKAYRAQNWDQAEMQLLNLMRMNPKKYLYQLYSDRVASMRLLPLDPSWDGATNFETK